MRSLLRASLVAATSLLLILPAPAARASSACSGYSASANWGYAIFGSSIGVGNIRLAQAAGRQEIYFPAQNGNVWVALVYDAARHAYEQSFVSPYYPTAAGPYSPPSPRINRLDVGNVTGDAGSEIVVMLSNGMVEIYDQLTKAHIAGFQTAATSPRGLGVADIDGDASDEIVLCDDSQLYVYSGAGDLEWDLAGVGGRDLQIAQMDGDAALEIAATSGQVVDAATHQVQFNWPHGFGTGVNAGDIDGDGKAELITAEQFLIAAYDVDRQLPKWTLSTTHHGDVSLADLDGDTVPEILVGRSSYPMTIDALDAMTLQSKGSIPLSDTGVTDIATGDVDGDGDLDVIYGAGADTSGPDHLYVTDWQTKQIGWQSIDYTGPLAGPQIGDLDGDGRLELVTVSLESDSGYEGPRILVFDARSRRLRAVSGVLDPGYIVYGGENLKLRDVDGDGREEILVATDYVDGGSVEIFDFDAPNTFTSAWRNSTSPDGGPFGYVDAADVDGDGSLEIVGSPIAANSGSQGNLLFVYDYATRNEEWHSPSNGYASSAGMELADVDGDGHQEMVVASLSSALYVYDGVTKALEASIPGHVTALAVDRTTNPPSIVVGTQEGELVTYAHAAGGAPYVEVLRRTVSAKRIDGVTMDDEGRAWVGSDGRLTLVDPTSACLWSSDNFGPGFGTHTAFLPGSAAFFSAGSYAVVGFNTPRPASSRTPGIYVPSTSTFFLRNQNAPGPADLAFSYGPGGAGLVPLAGDWDGDGVESVGLYDPATGNFFLKNTSSGGTADLVFSFGAGGVGVMPVVGDFDGNGTDTVGIYIEATGAFFLKNANAAGPADAVFSFGPGGADVVPLFGDYDGNGTDTVGIYNRATGVFFLKNANGGGSADVVFGFGPGGAGVEPLVGDYDGDGADTVGVYVAATGAWFLRNANGAGAADVVFSYGPSGLVPLVGDWDGF